MPHPSADGGGSVIEADDAGVIGDHAQVQVQPFLVAPTRNALGNGLSLDIVPMACLNLGDVLFEFDSSVVTPQAGVILSKLPALRRSKPNAKGDLPLVSVFAHADPSGDDDYNKTLAGRRARAVYALLVHDVGMWEALYKSPFGGDDWSKKMRADGMADAVGLPHGTARHELFDAFMTALMPEPLDRADFLGRGADAKGKADYQGCGEFNPLLMLSAEDQTKLKKEERNGLNLVNRRVVIFLFRPELKVDVGSWPCPRAEEGTADCHKRFFLNAPKRRTPGPERVKHHGPADETFACRFYDRMAGASPCEQILLQYRVRLFDKEANPLPGAPFTISDGKRTIVDKADDDAFATIRDIKVPANVEVQWSPAGDDTQKFQLTVHVEIEGQDQDASLRRLHNLGYEGSGEQDDDVRAFQRDHADRFPDMTDSGLIDPATASALQQVNDGCDPNVRGSASAPERNGGKEQWGADHHDADADADGADAGEPIPPGGGDLA